MSYPSQPNDAGPPNDNPFGQNPNQPPPAMPPQGFNPGGPQQFGGSPTDFGAPAKQPNRRQFKFTRFGLLAVFGACVLGYLTYQALMAKLESKQDPTRMTLSQLMTQGPGDNLYLELDEVFLLDRPAVIESRNENDANWQKMWIDAVPSVEADDEVFEVEGMELEAVRELQAALGVVNGRKAGAKPVGNKNVVMYFDDITNEMEYHQRCAEETHTGMVMNRIRSLDKKTADLLAEEIPGFDRENTLIFEVGGTPGAIGKMMFLLLGLSVVCLIVGLLLFFPKV